jgi:hypothetical protein
VVDDWRKRVGLSRQSEERTVSRLKDEDREHKVYRYDADKREIYECKNVPKISLQ